ncbi:methyltransferase family protein [Fredinandcohnia onubensis]|uniref:methyltransferase family protein n=1 Tax=Fredinandcohnia onubensis TaxID=1571209 RepID=UPI000C0BECD0|nr:isoprenylcysteine carboxylmethyltransferase family protein [Fredinandcohnia onubensis]
MIHFIPLIISLLIWALGELYVYVKLTNKDGQIQDKGSSRALELGTIIMLSLSIYFYFWEIGNLNSMFLEYLGIAVTLLGVSFRQYSIYVLGKFFSGYIRVTTEHTLIQNGPYKYFRHPSYFGSTISYLGIGLTTSNIFSIIVLPLGISILYFYRVKVEEELMLNTFGDQYLTYKSKTWGFLPFIK